MLNNSVSNFTANVTIHKEPSGSMEEHWYNFITSTLSLIAGVGAPANLVTIVMIAKSKKLWNRQILLILNLACADFFMSTVGIALPLASSVHRRWIFGRVGCALYGFATNLVGIAAITTLAFLAFDRALIVRQSNWRNFVPSETRHIVSAIWVYSFLVTGPPLVGWGAYVPEGPGISCSIDWQSTSFSSLSYIVFLYIAGFFLQLLLVSCSYAGIFRTVHEATTKQLPESRTAKRAETRVALMLTVMLVCFLIAWLPYSIIAIAKVWAAIKNDSSLLTFLNGIGGYSSALLAKSSIAYNPIIYVFFNTQFRLAWRNFPVGQVSAIESRKTGISTNQITIHRSSHPHNAEADDSQVGHEDVAVVALHLE